MFEIDENNLPFVRTRRALLLLDLQNDFVGEKSLLPVEKPTGYLENIQNLVRQFRLGGDVIWIRSIFPEGKSRVVNEQRSDSENIITDNELPNLHQDSPSLQELAQDKSEEDKKSPALSTDDQISESFLTVEPGGKAHMVQADSPGSDFADSIKPHVFAKDMTFLKTYYSAFRDGNLVQTLRGKFVTEIYICGVLTNVSIFATAMDAARHGYAITIVDDCLGYRSKARHEEALRQLKVYTGCDVISSFDLIESCQKQKKAAERRSASSKKPRPKPKETRSEESRKTGIESLMGNLKLEAEEPQATPTSSTKATASDDEFETTSQLLRAHVRRAKPPAEIEAEAKKRDRVKTKVKTRRRPSNAAPEKLRVPSSIVSSPAKEERIQPTESPTAKEDTVTKSPEEVSEKVPEKVIPKDSVINRTPKKSIDLKEQELAVLGGICEGDTTVIENLLPEGLASGIFEKIRDEVLWQKMAHQGGEVPRLVGVQGKVEEDGSIPIYRHPADESPPLSPFSPTVLTIKSEVEKKLGHSVNHVLIQFYRNGTDNISEHSDKTLDIVPNTFIANVSLGAQRTMVFRTKKSLKGPDSTKDDEKPRESCRAPLPHNSLCKMGLETNKKWLHGIRPDKRMEREKSEAELAFDGGRISLTFRNIGTYLDKTQLKIWGQGATAKRKEDAEAVINGDTQEAKDMLQAFGRENHDSNFDWKESYGKGFNVLHFSNDKKLFLSGDFVTDFRIRFMLNEYQVPWVEGKLSPGLKWEDLNSKTTRSPVREILPVKFVDNDAGRTTVEGYQTIMLYIHAAYGPKRDKKDLAYLGRQFTRYDESNGLLNSWRTVPFNAKLFRFELAKWEAYAEEEGDYIAGDEIGLADFAVVPVLEMVSKEWVGGEAIKNLADYWQRLVRRDSVVKLFAENEVQDMERRINLCLAAQNEIRALKVSGEGRMTGKTREDTDKGKDIEELVDGVAKL
jgi:nicotinamidase-related amidase/alkylated DNA repair dioxygenase AlkB